MKTARQKKRPPGVHKPVAAGRKVTRYVDGIRYFIRSTG